MMKNKKGTIILSIILAVQFLIPLSVWSYGTYKNKELEEKGQEIKVLVDFAYFNEGVVEFESFTLREALFNDETKYIAFENNGENFSTVIEAKEKPETDIYVSSKRLYSWYSEEWYFIYESDVTKKAQDEYDWYRLYDRDIEKANISHGFCEGPETQAYAIFKVYKNRFKVVNIYIDGMPVDEVVEKYNSDEWDNSRYDEHYGDGEDYEFYYDEESKDYCKEYYDEELDEFYKEYYDEESGEYYRAYYDEELDEYVTEPVTA